jgi:hypothetical protein
LIVTYLTTLFQDKTTERQIVGNLVNTKFETLQGDGDDELEIFLLCRDWQNSEKLRQSKKNSLPYS